METKWSRREGLRVRAPPVPELQWRVVRDPGTHRVMHLDASRRFYKTRDVLHRSAGEPVMRRTVNVTVKEPRRRASARRFPTHCRALASLGAMICVQVAPFCMASSVSFPCRGTPICRRALSILRSSARKACGQQSFIGPLDLLTNRETSLGFGLGTLMPAKPRSHEVFPAPRTALLQQRAPCIAEPD